MGLESVRPEQSPTPKAKVNIAVLKEEIARLEKNKVVDTRDVEEETSGIPENNYQRYVKLGGIINEKDYQSALARSKHTTTVNQTSIMQADNIAKRSGISLHNSKDSLDPRTILYGILRSDTVPEPKYHHSQMNDQRLFAEALRMLGDTDSLEKLIEAHPNIFSS